MGNDYNGYSNRETWSASMYLKDNESFLITAVREVFTDSPSKMSRAEISSNLEDFIESYFEPSWWYDNIGDSMPDKAIRMLADIGSLWRVECDELVDILLEAAPDYLDKEVLNG